MHELIDRIALARRASYALPASVVAVMANLVIDLTRLGGFDNLTSTTSWILGAMKPEDLRDEGFLMNKGQIFKQKLKRLYTLLEEWKDQYPDSYNQVFLAENCVPYQSLGEALDWIDMIYLLDDEETIAEKTKEYALSVEEVRYTNSQWVSLLMQNTDYHVTLMAQLADTAKRVSEAIHKTLTEVSTPETIEFLKQKTLENIKPPKPIDIIYVDFDQSGVVFMRPKHSKQTISLTDYKRVLKRLKVSKAFAVKACLYRRLARSYNADKWTFTLGDLQELYQYESTGKRTRSFDEMKKTNGFALGKWLRDIDVANYREAYLNGEFAKIEFLSTDIERLHNKHVFDNLPLVAFFPFPGNAKRKNKPLGMNTKDLTKPFEYYPADYKGGYLSKMADTVIELKEIAQLPRDADVLLFFLKCFKVEDFSKLTEEKVPLFKTKLKELYEQVEKWKEVDPEVYASVFQHERSISYPSLDELYELVDLLIHQNHNPPSGDNTSTLNAEEKVIEYTYLSWAVELDKGSKRYAERFIKDTECALEKEMKAYRESLGDKWVPPKKPTKEEMKEMAKYLAIALIERTQNKEQEK